MDLFMPRFNCRLAGSLWTAIPHGPRSNRPTIFNLISLFLPPPPHRNMSVSKMIHHTTFTKSWSDILCPACVSCIRSGRFTIDNFEHLMGGVWILVGVLGEKYVDPRFHYWSAFVGIMMVQCSFTGFSPPRIVFQHLLGVADSDGVIWGKKQSKS